MPELIRAERKKSEGFVEVFKYPDDYYLESFPDDYINYGELPFRYYELLVNVWIQTKDNWIVPILKTYPGNWSCITIPFPGGTYSRRHIQVGGHVRLYPLEDERSSNALAKKHYDPKSKLTEKQARFCFVMAKCWNIEEAMRVSGFQDKFIVFRILDYPKIKRGIMEAIHMHMEAGEINKEYVVKEKQKIIDELANLRARLKEDLMAALSSGGPENAKDAEKIIDKKFNRLTDTLKQSSEEINDWAAWLQYGKEESDPTSQDTYLEYYKQVGVNSNSVGELPNGKNKLLPTVNSFDNNNADEKEKEDKEAIDRFVAEQALK